MEIYKKLAAARAIIKALPLKKAGWNDYSKYHYFTPEQINSMVYQVETECGLLHLFSMKQDQDGIHGHLQIIDIETQEVINFVQATGIPEIKATNIAQQLGGAVTYTNRYMLMTAYDIVDNTLDFDAKDNREPEKKVIPTANGEAIPEKSKFPISKKAFDQLCERLKANADPKDRGNLLAKTRRYYPPFTEEQENAITQILDNI